MRLTGKLAPDFKTIADFRRNNSTAIKTACQRFVAVCRVLGLVGGGLVAVDGSKFRTMNTHGKNSTKAKLQRRRAQVEESVERYLAELEVAGREESNVAPALIERPSERLASLRGRLGELEEIGRRLETAPNGQLSLTDADARSMSTATDPRGVVGYNLQTALDTKHHLVIANEVTNKP